MRVFLTGASGYIGGSIAVRLRAAGHRVVGLARVDATAERLRDELGVEPLVGTLDDAALLRRVASDADAVINTADADHRGAAEALIAALAGSGKPLLHTSGSSIVADRALGERGERVFDDRDFDRERDFTPVPEKAHRVAIDRLVRDAAARAIRTAVICPSLIYGHGLGLHAESVQLPLLAAQARESGVPRYIGRGENVWSHVHIEDLADLYVLALEGDVEPGAFLFAENGEASFKAMVEALSRALGFGGRAESWGIEEAVRAWGEVRAIYSLASNSRVRASTARERLGWRPRHASVIAAVESAPPAAARSADA